MKYFTIEELCKSSTANALHINNTPSAATKISLRMLIENVLDPLREAYGRPILVNSGFRCTELNRAVNGAPKSDHLLGQAADITAGTMYENKVLFDLAQKLDLPFKQLIDESDFSWVHIAYDPNDIRKQVLHLD